MKKVYITQIFKDYEIPVKAAISIKATKPEVFTSDEWDLFKDEVCSVAEGNRKNSSIEMQECVFDITCIEDDREYGILAESEHYYIRREHEDAILYAKPDSQFITGVAEFFDEPKDAYIDPEERFCIVAGNGIIRYDMHESFEYYSGNSETEQWIETDQMLIERIEEVSDACLVVLLQEGKKLRLDLPTLKNMDNK